MAGVYPAGSKATMVYVPGLLCSSLFQRPNFTLPLWADTTALLVKGITAMALAPDGITPLPPFGIPLYPADAYKWASNYLPTLSTQIPPFADLRSFAYDWRRATENNAADLYAFIKPLLQDNRPTIIVGHSMGGLLAVQAAALAFADGFPPALLYVITLGTPFYGSYDVPAQLDPQGPADIGLIADANLGFILDATKKYFIDAYQSTIATWPGFVELSPDGSSPSPNPDPLRRQAYVGSWVSDYRDTNLAGLLAVAGGAYRKRINAALATVAGRLMTVVGAGLPTRVGFLRVPNPFNSFTFNVGDGDGVVPVWSSTVSGIQQQVIQGVGHSDLPTHVVQTGWLATIFQQLTHGPVNIGDAFLSTPFPVPPIPPEGTIVAKLVPVTSAAIITVLTRTDGFRNKCAVLIFPTQIPDATTYLLGTYRNYRIGDRAARSGGVIPGAGARGCLYQYSVKTATWYAVPTVRDPNPLT